MQVWKQDGPALSLSWTVLLNCAKITQILKLKNSKNKACLGRKGSECMEEGNLTQKKLENLLSNQIKSLYQKELKHELKKINYELFNDKLIIIMEGTLTRPELVLNETNRKELVKKVRKFFDKILQAQIKNCVEEVLEVTVTDFLCKTNIETARTGAIAIFELQSATSV